MKRDKGTSNAVEILKSRYIRGDQIREASLEAERVNADVAQMIYDLRGEAGLTQKDLGDLVGTTQSVISRLEDADYEGHSLTMLNRIAKALNQKLTVSMTAKDPEAETLRLAFQTALQGLRRSKGWTLADLAKRLDVDKSEAIAMERYLGYRPTPLVIHKLSKLYGVAERRLAALAGAFGETSEDVRESASRFAAQAESFAQLSKEEKKALDDFVRFLKTDSQRTV